MVNQRSPYSAYLVYPMSPVLSQNNYAQNYMVNQGLGYQIGEPTYVENVQRIRQAPIQVEPTFKKEEGLSEYDIEIEKYLSTFEKMNNEEQNETIESLFSSFGEDLKFGRLNNDFNLEDEKKFLLNNNDPLYGTKKNEDVEEPLFS